MGLGGRRGRGRGRLAAAAPRDNGRHVLRVAADVSVARYEQCGSIEVGVNCEPWGTCQVVALQNMTMLSHDIKWSILLQKEDGKHHVFHGFIAIGEIRAIEHGRVNSLCSPYLPSPWLILKENKTN